jgi:SH3-like domain-containing protein
MRRGFWYFAAFIGLLIWLGREAEPTVALVEPLTGQQTQPAITEKPPVAAPEIKTEPKPLTQPALAEQRFVAGNRVGFRAGPSQNDAIIDRLEAGRAVDLIEAGPEWSKVHDPLTRREGWIASRLLRSEPIQREAKPAPAPKPKVERKKPTDTNALIARIIAESIQSYPGNCPCPYNTDRGGRRCGKRSAYSKPGGYSPICFAEDVTPDMIEAMRARN